MNRHFDHMSHCVFVDLRSASSQISTGAYLLLVLDELNKANIHYLKEIISKLLMNREM